ncbi:MAG: TA system VapC family ribonuclease toxin [Sphingomonas sp.]
MTFLLDVNVLIALIDPAHVGHDAAHLWLERDGRRDWATCPITQNGVVRIVGHPRYPNTPGSAAEAAAIVASLCALEGHSFWSDDISLFGNDRVDPSEIRTPAQVTDSYLLALAAAHGGKLATFDRKLSVRAVRGGRKSLHVIGGEARH